MRLKFSLACHESVERRSASRIVRSEKLGKSAASITAPIRKGARFRTPLSFVRDPPQLGSDGLREQQATVHIHICPCQERRLVRGQINHQIGDIFRTAFPLQRCDAGNMAAHFGLGVNIVEVSVDHSGAYSIHPNFRPQLFGQATGKGHHRPF